MDASESKSPPSREKRGKGGAPIYIHLVLLEVVAHAELHRPGDCEGFQAGECAYVAARQIVHGQATVDIVKSVEVLPREGQRLTFG